MANLAICFICLGAPQSPPDVRNFLAVGSIKRTEEMMDSVLLRCIILRVFVFSRAYINVCPRAGMHCIEYSLVFKATECAESIAAQM